MRCRSSPSAAAGRRRRPHGRHRDGHAGLRDPRPARARRLRAGPTAATAWRPGRSRSIGCATSSGSAASAPSHAGLRAWSAGRSAIRCRRPCTTPPSRRTGVDGVYIPCEASDFDDFLALADALGIAGASVTAPFKEDAARTGRAGTARSTRCGGATAAGTALNTDVDGFLAPLAGGDARRPPGRGRRRRRLGALGRPRPRVARGTRVGARPAAGSGAGAGRGRERRPLDRGRCRAAAGICWSTRRRSGRIPTSIDRRVDAGDLDGALVYDLVYNPRPTRLLRDAAAAGCRTLDGLDMLVAQAVRQFAWWTGVTPEARVLREAAERRLAAMAPPSAGSARTEAGTSV